MPTREIVYCQIQLSCDHPRRGERSKLWTMWPIFHNNQRFFSQRADLTKKENTDHQACLPTQVFSQVTCTLPEEKLMTGAHAVILKFLHSVTVNANGYWLDVAQSHSTSLNPAITNFATASYLPMLPSAMELINISGNGETRIIADSGQFGVLLPSGDAGATGCSHSTDERIVLAGYVHI